LRVPLLGLREFLAVAQLLERVSARGVEQSVEYLPCGLVGEEERLGHQISQALEHLGGIYNLIRRHRLSSGNAWSSSRECSTCASTARFAADVSRARVASTIV